MFFRNLFIGISFLFVFACDKGRSKDPSSYILNTSVDAKCRSLDYRQVLVSYFNQELAAGEQALSEQEKQIDKAFGCMRKVLTQINSEMRGESTNSLSKEELKTLLTDPEIQKHFEGLGFQNVKVSMERLTKDKTFDQFMEKKNFVVNVIAYFSGGLSSERVCGSSRNRLYKREMEILIHFLDNIKDFLKEINFISEKVYSQFIKNSVQQANMQTLSYFSSPEGKHRVRKSLFSVPDNDVMKYLFPALSYGFSEEPEISSYFNKSHAFLEQPPSPFRYLSWSYHFSVVEKQERFERDRVRKFEEAVSLMVNSNTINSSLFLAKSDIQFIVMMASLTNVLLNAYDRNGDSLITKEEFQNSTSCMEGFLLPLFKENEKAFYHFVEFQEDATKDWTGYYLNKWMGDEDFVLNRGDLSKITAVLMSAFFPYGFFEKEDNEKRLLLKLREVGVDSKESDEEDSSSPLNDDLIGI